jgi:hypothetical protein
MKLPDFAMLVVLAIVSAALALFAFSMGGMDFGVYYAAAQVARHGGNPYDYGQLADQIVLATGEVNNPYYYAPWFTWALIPLSFLSYETARVVWALLNFVLWFFGLFNLGKIIHWPQRGWRRWGMYTLVTFVFAWSTWGFEQVGILIFFMFTMVLVAWENDKPLQAGLWLALTLFKPNITAIPVVVLAAWLLLHKKWRPVIAAGIAVTAMIAVSFVISPNWHQALMQPDKLTGLSYTLDTSGATVTMRQNTTLMDWLRTYGVAQHVSVGVYAVAIICALAAIGLSIRFSSTLVQTAAVVLLVNFAITPYALFYDYPVIVITFFYINSLRLTSSFSTWVRHVLNSFVLFSLFLGDTISFRYWIVVALAVLMTFTFIMRRVGSGDGPEQVGMSGSP